MRILGVAEKPSIAKAIAQALGSTRSRETKEKYIRNYDAMSFYKGRSSSVTVTSVLGHLYDTDFPENTRDWQSVPLESLWRTALVEKVNDKMKKIADNIRTESKNADMLMIWTDCDREGEYIGSCIAECARNANPSILVTRAHFSNIEPSHIRDAFQKAGQLDTRAAQAVAARREIDLRVGAIFTRYLTLQLRNVCQVLNERLISFGTCQFPTLGFVVDRYNRVKSFVPEPHWSIRLSIKPPNGSNSKSLPFRWSRGVLYDKFIATTIYERCLLNSEAIVKSFSHSPTEKLRPLPLTTVELQKTASKYLGLNSKRILQLAEELYNKGLISYPRTETDQFDSEIDLKKLVMMHKEHSEYGRYASMLLDPNNKGPNRYLKPRKGLRNDHAHPPIHPIRACNVQGDLSNDHYKVYKYVTRHFLACCSHNAVGARRRVIVNWGEEQFSKTSLAVIHRNYLDVYIYDQWQSTEDLPELTAGQHLEISSTSLNEGKSAPPSYLTEPELIALMDANQIGTDATMAEHIDTIIKREYIFMKDKKTDRQISYSERSRGTSRQGTIELVPSALGKALIDGYDNMNLEKSLTKPLLRKELEVSLKEICDGKKLKTEVTAQVLRMYEDMFNKTKENFSQLKDACQSLLN
ncbi:hypothetical protein CANCADRAFT_140658 [Tortispora caseinolytica NRRL Y-17796]|uniref:DNA topoisomerase n=1 Tax=Tortispora caseinolytica NRRL Y-17796 TaxID=767744 RepID=A0A1E4TD21_9ASCO|nr:hypothetical protein CANCADRAFT_140658 [Tortispora caseinolytica NRRL Y-17796]